jgi:hypothetical protein
MILTDQFLARFAQRSAAEVYSSIPYDDIKKLEADWRADWTREAMVRIIERRSE